MTTPFKELDVIRITQAVKAKSFPEGLDVSIPAGSTGAVVLVFERAIEVEFILEPPFKSALALVSFEDAELQTQ